MENKPKVYSSAQYNLNELPSDRKFEELIYRIFQNRVNDDLKELYDKAYLMPGVAEKGIDVLLKKNGKNEGVVQCKMNTSGNLNKTEAAKEIIKFVLNYYLDKSLINNLDSFKYYFVVSGKFSSTTIKLLGAFKNEIIKEPKLQKWTEEVIHKYSTLQSLNYGDIENDFKQTLSKLELEQINYSDINAWINKYESSGIANEFFSIKTVVDSASIDKGINKLIETINPKVESKIDVFLKSYYSSAKNHLDVVKFIGHDISIGNRPRNITVSKLYVDPYFTVNKNIKSGGSLLEEFRKRKKRELRIHDVFKRSKHYIILGDPGSGKSLMVKNLILRFMKKNAKTGGLKNYKNHIPFRIELRKYNEKRHKENMNIVDYLTTLLKTEYQLNDIDEKTISYIIQHRPTLFFFDGLDEIFDIAQKNCIKEDIVNFISVNKNVKCIVTSRFIGYHDVQFPEDQFYEFAIQNFNEKQIEKFIEKFYSSQIRNKSDKSREIESCKRQVKEIDDDLKSNPLILSLMTLLAINKVIIPDSRLDVYRSCTNTLVETRDKDEKQLNIKLRVNNKRGTFGKLAYWQYNQISNKKTVTRTLAKKAVAEYLVSKNEFEDLLEAEDAASHFLEYAESRSIYFENNFTHKTFLEYYTANHIFTRYHNNHKKHVKRDEIIQNNIKNSAWHVVFELLISMIDEHLDESEVMDEIIQKQLKPESPEINYFFLSVLKQTKNIGDDIKKQIIKNSILLIIKEKDINIKKSKYLESNGFFSLICELNNNNKIKALFQEVIYNIEMELENDNDRTNLYIFLYELDSRFGFLDKNSGIKFEYKAKDKLEQLRKTNLNLFTYYYENSIRKMISEQVKFFGFDSIFEDIPFKFQQNVTRLSTFYNYLSQKDTFSSYQEIIEDMHCFSGIGLDFQLFGMQNRNIRIDLFLIDDFNVKIKNLIKILIKSSDERLDNFIRFIFSFVSLNTIKSMGSEFAEEKKFKNLIQSIEANKKKGV
ncbi:MAG: NACHT domain-containing protein [Bacteroidales bacterium]|nr:NACHT domain-containing protein [Bacteroidales bacterium]